ncbi:MAG: EAL domain-containing protein [Alphaproteobacteria bacterium]|nr:EAL domain-containing protein [Alphaproteobacteria bacterium]MCD8570620.1 EAL domain-containing protein [Alphaproteobacteria bacterium]
MADASNLKQQRDRFLAFSFASSDLLLEVGEDGKVGYALGASQGIIGVNDKTLEGMRWLDLFAAIDRPVLKTMMEKARAGQRCGPILVALNEGFGKHTKALVTGIKMPDTPNFYVTLGLGSVLMAKLAEQIRKDQEGKLLDKDSFAQAAMEAFDVAKSLGTDIDITLLDLAITPDKKSEFGEEGWDSFVENVSALLRSKSVDGTAAAQIADGRYSVVHDKSIDPETLKQQISQLSQDRDPTGEGISVQSKTITSDVSTLSERDTARALIYTINEFERKGADLTIENLNSGFKSYLAANAQKIKDFQNLITRLNFQLFFQPIVDTTTLQVSHYEMLSRFEEGDTMEWVVFGEDIGMASEFDIAVCERAINYLVFKGGVTHTKFSVNLSGQSIESSAFFDKLMKQLSQHPNLSGRLMFEITESSNIKDLEKVGEFVSELQKKGFTVALDDFGSGSASFQYLQSLNVDYVKIDGKYIRKLLTSQRDASMVKNLTQMCKDLGIKVIAEFVEEEAQLNLLRSMGVDYVQGYLLGKPGPKPDYVKPASLAVITPKIAKNS